MYNNIGGKIKLLAVLITAVYSALSIYCGCSILFGNKNVLGWLFIVLGPLVSWLSSFVLYGFGQLIQNSQELCDRFCEREKETVKDIYER